MAADNDEDADALERSRAEFESKVRAAPRATPPAPGGKGSPVVLLTIGLVSTLVLGATAAALGGGLLFLPALIPLVTVLAVLAARLIGRRGRSSSSGGP